METIKHELYDAPTTTVIEVKAEVNVKSKSLHGFVVNDHAVKHLKGLRCSMLPYKDQGWMENIPLYGISGYIKHQYCCCCC